MLSPQRNPNQRAAPYAWQQSYFHNMLQPRPQNGQVGNFPHPTPTGGGGNFPIPPTGQPAPQPAPVYTPQINTSITPQSIYSQQQTQQATNVAKALQDQQADLRFQMKQFAAPGRSYDAGTMAAAMPYVSDATAAGNLAMGAIPLQDLIANQKNLLSGEIAREGEATGWGNLLARQYDNSIGRQSQNTSQILSVLSRLLMNPGDSTDYSSLLGAF